MKIKDFLTKTNTTALKFAVMIDVRVQSVHRYINGERIPKPDVMVRIKAATKGKVSADDFMLVSIEKDKDE